MTTKPQSLGKQYTLLQDNGSFLPLSVHPTLRDARKTLRAIPKNLAAKYRASENATGKISYTTHFVIAEGVIAAREKTQEHWEYREVVEGRIVERWIADRNSAERA